MNVIAVGRMMKAAEDEDERDEQDVQEDKLKELDGMTQQEFAESLLAQLMMRQRGLGPGRGRMLGGGIGPLAGTAACPSE